MVQFPGFQLHERRSEEKNDRKENKGDTALVF